MYKLRYLGLCVLVIFSVVAAARASKITFTCPAGWDMIGTHCYNFVNISMDFEDAKDVCEKYGAQLLVIRDEVEAKNVSSVALQKLNTNTSFWLYNGRYEQDSGKGSLDSTFCKGMWQPNEPRETNEDVGIASNMQGRWALSWVWSNLPFVCRAPACPTGSFRCSDGTCLNKKWTCDGAYDCKDMSDENDCTDGVVKYYTNSPGTVDHRSIANSGLFYQWIIESEPGQVLRIEFETLAIEDHVDNVRVYSGGPSIVTSDLIREIRTSSTTKLSVFSKNHFVIVTLQLYTSNIQQVKFNWKPDNEASWKQVQIVDVTNSDSSISSPYYNSSMAPVSFKREWLLRAPEGEVITLEVLDNTLELNASSDLYIVTNVGFVLKELNSHKAIYISSTNSMSVIIKTRSVKKDFSFNARHRKGCDFITNLTLATFTLKNLPTNLSCNWTMQNEVATNFRLQINETFIASSSDVLQIYNGSDVRILNHSTNGIKEYESVPSEFSIKYVSDIFHPGIEFSGKISGGCQDFQNGQMNLSYSNTSAGELYKAQLSCPDGFRFKQEEYSNSRTLFAVCKEGGIWDLGSPSYTRTPECQIVYCGFPPPIPNGFVNSINGNSTYKSVASYQCFSGFEIKGAPNVTCRADGSWSVTPSCIADNCSDILNVTHGSSNSSDVSEGSVVTFSCDPGYSLHGPRTIACMSNKTWSHQQPECKELTCPLPVIEHGHYEHKSIPKFGEPVVLACDSGYQINRTQSQNDTSIICSLNRTLSVENDTCVDINECRNSSANNCTDNENCVNLVGSYSCDCKSGFTGADCTDVDECVKRVCDQNCSNLNGSYSCSCYEGYVLYIENGTNGFYIPSGEDGLKPGDVYQINNTCVPVTCNKGPEPPANGTVLTTKSTYYYNERVNFGCNFGYILENNSFATCSSDGNWTYSTNPICKNMSCPQPSVGEHEASRVPAIGDIEPGASLTITCHLHDGSGNFTNKTLFCAPSPDASWNFTLQGDDPTCPEVNCGKPLPIPGGNFTVSNTTYGSSFEFACDSGQGFTMTGASTLGNTTVVCQSNGRWGFANLTCEGPRCKDPGTMGGTVQIVNTSYEIDQVVQYNCTRPGFTPVTNATLVCEYKNGTAQWSSDPPVCEDAEPPEITCPTLDAFDLYSTLVYPLPNVTDSSGTTCFMIESGLPSGVSLVSGNGTVRYKATDTQNNATCEINVTVKDCTEPKMECPSYIQKDLAGSRNELFNLNETLLISHSGDGTIKFDPMGPLNLTVGSVLPVRVNITKENGLVKECAFLVSAVSSACRNDSLPPLDHGRIESCTGNDNKMECVGICDKGYLFQNASNSTSYSCVNGTWDMDFPVQSCIKLYDPIYKFHVTLQYTLNGSKISRPPQKKYSPDCPERHCIALSEHVKNISACGYDTFLVINCSNKEDSRTTDKTSFILQLLTTGRNETSLSNCVDTLQNQSVTLFGPTYPMFGPMYPFTTNTTCLSPWSVKSNTVEIEQMNSSCSNNSLLLDYNGMEYCLPCGLGTFYNHTTEKCQQCQDGYYQDEEGQIECKVCPNGVLKSHVPRTQASHCFELCREGFESISDDNCTACHEDHFSISINSSCQPCPNNGSTLGVSGATSQAQCSDPCSPGEYSITGHEPCSLCPKNFYSISHRERVCKECPSDTFTAGNGSNSTSDCLNANSSGSECTPNFCNPAGTVNNGLCGIVDHRPLCQCKPGFYGDSCNKSCDVCNPNPCYNGGTCTASGLDFTCTCKNETCTFKRNEHIQYTTDHSIVLISYGIGNNTCHDLCLNNSSCVAYLFDRSSNCYQYNSLLLDIAVNNGDESYVKNCSGQQLFNGSLCEIDLKNDCDDSSCANIDFCMDLVEGHKCHCPYDGGDYDSRCEKSDDPCQGNNCSLHGKCIPYGSVRAVCECHPGYTGDRCEIDIDECEINSHGCLYNGSCQDGVNNYSCSCVNGFSGRHCEVLPDFCHHNDCKVAQGGICTNDFQNFNASCTCGEHYTRDPQKSDACIPIAYCGSSPCVNGTCTDVFGGFTCDCITGFQGSHCQHNIDDCVNYTCQNGATCVDGVSNYTCICPAGFRGSLCEENTDGCSEKCVVNNTEGVCHDLVEDYYCPCKPAYTGKNCSENVSMCTVYEPCLHGENCSDFSGGYNCTCAAGWTGENCDQEINYCSSNPCKNNGVCYNLVDQYFCKCSNGTAGRNCEHGTGYLCDKFNDSVCSSKGKCELIEGTIGCQCLREYSGKACELEKDFCADDPCNEGICTLSNLTYVCDCSNVKNYDGENCNETKTTCSTSPACPKNTTCREFEDQDGYLRLACMCLANETFVGNTCTTVDRDYDLAFLESFAKKGTSLTSESGFFLDNNTDLSITMWVAAAKQLDNDNFILALKSSKTNYSFLSVFNTRVQVTTNRNISVELTEDIGIKYSLDESFTWHLIGILWSTNGNFEIWFDSIQVNQTNLSASPPSDWYVFVHLGQSFYGYISQVSVWKTALTPKDLYDIFNNKLAVPQPDSLLLGWTQYSFDSSVRRTKTSTAAGSFSICDITDTIALMEINSPQCKNTNFIDKTPPEVNYCNESKLLPTDYSKHQVSSSELGYTFTDDTDGSLSSEGQQFSYGAYDIAVSAEDSEGNIGVCMTRAYITPNRCSDTEPPQGYLAHCSDNINGKRVTCPAGMLPSVPTPNYVSCSNLLTYNLDDLYEKPDRIVCGERKPLSVTVNMVLPYRIAVNCSKQLVESIGDHMTSAIKTLNASWRGLCSDKNCSNVKPSVNCTGSRSLDAHIKISGLSETLSSPGLPPMTPLEIMSLSVADGDTFNFSKIAGAHLENKNQLDESSLCDKGYSTSGNYCVQCGAGSYYDEGETKCKLCELDTYSDQPGSINCTACPPNNVTLQRGSSNITDCKEKCHLGQMLNLAINGCIPCPKNFYQDREGKSYCFPCPPATGTENNGSKSQADCIVDCPEGEEDINGTCVSCPDDHYKQSPGVGLCLNCTGDVTSTQSNRSFCTQIFCDVVRELKAGNCSDCDYGYYKSSRGNDSCIQCTLNTTASKASTSDLDCSRVICPAGSYRNESTNTCFLCELGTYQDLPGNNSCISCNFNYTTHSKGSNDSSQCYELCPPGTYRNGTYNCVPCPVGQYQNESDQTSCKPCGDISGYNASTVSTQTTNESDCFPICPEGFHLDNGSRSCMPCPVGTFKSKKNLDTRCESCKINFTTLGENETKPDACILDKCKKGYYRDASSTACKPCPVGEYQHSGELLNVTACTQCPAGYTTLLEGAPTRDGYCIRNCSKGEEYHMTFKNCSACPIGMYRPEGVREPPTCLLCPSGNTTLTTGESKCIEHQGSTLPAVKIDLSVTATISVQACSHFPVVFDGIKEVVLQLIRNQNNRYNGLCDDNCTSHLQIDNDNSCGSSRSKRQINGKATVNVTVKQIDAVLKRMDGQLRPSMAALMEAFYDLNPVQDLLNNYQISFDSVKGIECGQACVVSNFHYPQICVPGEFIGTDQCELCAKGSYSTDPVSKICELCPDGQTTARVGAGNISSCDGICATDKMYCGDKGNCAINRDGKSFCDCHSEYSGHACSQRQAAEDSNRKIVIGLTVGLGGFLLILLIIIGIIAYRRRADIKSTSTSEVSESDVLDYRFPLSSPTINWNDPPLYRGETIDLHDKNPSIYFKNGRFEVASTERKFEPISHSHIQNSTDDWD